MSKARKGMAAKNTGKRQDDFAGLTLAELIRRARAAGINASSRWKRETILAKLEAV